MATGVCRSQDCGALHHVCSRKQWAAVKLDACTSLTMHPTLWFHATCSRGASADHHQQGLQLQVGMAQALLHSVCRPCMVCTGWFCQLECVSSACACVLMAIPRLCFHKAAAVCGVVAAQVDAIVYLVDAADRERFPESQRELIGLLSDDGLSGVPFLILGNKIDLPYAVGEDELRHSLGLAAHTTGKGKVALDANTRAIEVFMCSVAKRMGYGDGFRWMSQYIK
eukprot:GHRQ01003133.1.p1 GENE.GHRQ01003133.1~~GHRQ01003133.1.p1  ORF type:complete len:225 (+),score=67.96 GHRQ01003133.1:638-1312(+)